MALAITVDVGGHSIAGNKRMVTGVIAFDSTYAVGGEALTANDVGLGIIDDICFTGTGHLGYIYYTDTTLPATTLNVEILCPTGGAAPTTVADPAVNTMSSGTIACTASAADIALTIGVGGRGIELGISDASSLTAIRFVAWGS